MYYPFCFLSILNLMAIFHAFTRRCQSHVQITCKNTLLQNGKVKQMIKHEIYQLFLNSASVFVFCFFWGGGGYNAFQDLRS